MSHATDQLARDLQRLGFTFDRTNTNNVVFYVHPSGQEVKFTQSPSDAQLRQTLQRAQRICGTTPSVNKRKTAQIKARAARDRQRLATEIAVSRQKLEDAAKLKAGALLRNYTMGQIRQIELFIESEERELSRLRSLMSQSPGGQRRALHTAGQR